MHIFLQMTARSIARGCHKIHCVYNDLMRPSYTGLFNWFEQNAVSTLDIRNFAKTDFISVMCGSI